MNKDKLKVLHCAPITIETSPNLRYAGTQRIVYALNRGLHELGHESYVAGTGDSDLGGYGTLIPTRENAIWPLSEDGVSRNTRVDGKEEMEKEHYEKVLDLAKELDVDVIHAHGELALTPKYREVWKDLNVPIVTTEHCPISDGKVSRYLVLNDLIKQGARVHPIAISNAHKRSCEAQTGIDFDGMVYNGLILDHLPFNDNPQDYLFWGAARISDKKGTDLAIEIANRTNKPIILGGVIHKPDQTFYENKVQPRLTWSLEGVEWEEQEAIRDDLVKRISNGEKVIKPGDVWFVGPLSDTQKGILYSNASALAFPNRWEEPFGLSFAESLATGTPVLGTDLGSIPELVQDGKTGFLAKASEGLDDNKIVSHLTDSVGKVSSLNRRDARDFVEKTFSMDQMTKKYVDVYRRFANE